MAVPDHKNYVVLTMLESLIGIRTLCRVLSVCDLRVIYDLDRESTRKLHDQILINTGVDPGFAPLNFKW